MAISFSIRRRSIERVRTNRVTHSQTDRQRGKERERERIEQQGESRKGSRGVATPSNTTTPFEGPAGSIGTLPSALEEKEEGRGHRTETEGQRKRIRQIARDLAARCFSLLSSFPSISLLCLFSLPFSSPFLFLRSPFSFSYIPVMGNRRVSRQTSSSTRNRRS